MEPLEIERRFLPTEWDRGILEGLTPKRIRQGYFEVLTPEKSFRIRLVDDLYAIATLKKGTGKVNVRSEKEYDIFPRTGSDLASLLDVCTYALEKDRYVIDGWELDIFHGPLEGIVLLEREFKTEEEAEAELVLPEWVGKATEVTDSITNLHLARLATYLRGSNLPALDLLGAAPKVRKVVMTGGPCSGKSKAISTLKKERNDIHFVPEVATILISQVGILPGRDPLARKRFQHTLYRVQRIFEATSAEFAAENGKDTMVIDRGLVDCAAYLDGGLDEMEVAFATSRDVEYRQYQKVICLDVPPREIYDANKDNNEARMETYEQAYALGERIKDVWSPHPNFRFIPSGDWDVKLNTIRTAIDSAHS